MAPQTLSSFVVVVAEETYLSFIMFQTFQKGVKLTFSGDSTPEMISEGGEDETFSPPKDIPKRNEPTSASTEIMTAGARFDPASNIWPLSQKISLESMKGGFG